MPLKKPIIAVLSGPSGSGKTTLCRMLHQKKGLAYIVSHTTRPKRVGETHGKDYFFVSSEKFQSMIAHHEFAEYAEVYGFYYGTAKAEVEKQLALKQNIVLDMDTKGALQLKQVYPKARLVFIDVFDDETLKKRLTQRSQDSAEVIAKRIELAKNERSNQAHYDCVIINQNLDDSFNKIVQFLNL